jgi:hypothetical protein
MNRNKKGEGHMLIEIYLHNEHFLKTDHVLVPKDSRTCVQIIDQILPVSQKFFRKLFSISLGNKSFHLKEFTLPRVYCNMCYFHM